MLGRGRAESWLRRLFIEDWSLKLLALAITLILWFAVSGQEPRIERELGIEARLEGKPATGFELKQVFAIPGSVRVQGPASHVNGLQKATTEPISIEGRRESFDLPRTAVHTSDPKVDVLDTVNVHIEIVATGSPKSNFRDTN